LVKPVRAENGYRVFREADMHQLNFLSKARGLGFSIEECRNLLTLYSDKSRASSDVKAIAADHVHRINQKIQELESMRNTLTYLMKSCAGDDRPDCRILNELSTRRHN